MSEDRIKRPSWWRVVLPYGIAALILWWVFRGIEGSRFLAALSGARLSLLIPAMAAFTLVYAFLDVLSYGSCYRWYVSPEVRVREMVSARLGSYLLHVLYTPLSTVANLVYMRKVKGAPVTWTLSAMALTSVHDLFSINAVVTAALILNAWGDYAPGISSSWLLPAALPWAIAAGYSVYWFTGIRDLRIFSRITNNGILRSCRFARPKHYAVLLGSRLAVALAGVLAHALLLRAFGIRAPLPVIAMAAPLMIGSSFMPVSGAGFGGPQVAAQILLPWAGGDEALVAAYSVSFSACFTLGRMLIGFGFLPMFLSDLRRTSPRMSSDPITGEELS